MGLGYCCPLQTLNATSHPQCHCEPCTCPPSQRAMPWIQFWQGHFYGCPRSGTRIITERHMDKSTDAATELRKQVEIPWEAELDTVQVCVCVCARQIL